MSQNYNNMFYRDLMRGKRSINNPTSGFKAIGPNYNIGTNPSLEGYVSIEGEAPNIKAEEIEKLTKNTGSLADELEKQGVKASKVKPGFSLTRISTWPSWTKYTPLIGDVYDIYRGGQRLFEGNPWGLAQAGLGTAGLATLGVGSLGKSIVKGAVKKAPSLFKSVSSLTEALAKRNPKLLSNYKLLSKLGSNKAIDLTHNPFIRLPFTIAGFGSNKEDNNIQEPEVANDNFWDEYSYSVPEDNPNYNEYDRYFGDIPDLSEAFSYDLSEGYPSYLYNNGNKDSIEDIIRNAQQEPELRPVTRDDFVNEMRNAGYTDDAINDALVGNTNGVKEIEDNIKAFNELAGDNEKIMLRPIVEDDELPDDLLTGSVEDSGEDIPSTNDLEYAQALADIDSIVSNYNREYQPYIEGLSNYLKDYDDKYRFYHDMKRYYAAMSGLANNPYYNTVPTNLDPRDHDATRLDLYKKLADEKIALADKERQLKGNIDLAKSLGYPLNSAFADKGLLTAYMNAKMADSRIKATQAIAELNRENQLKIAEMNNRRALEVAGLNSLSALERVKYQQNEANYRKSLDVQQKELDRRLKAAQKAGDWEEARKLEIYKQANSNKRTALTALTNYVTYGQDPSDVNIYDIVSILGNDIGKVTNKLKKSNKGGLTDGQLAKDFK